MRFVDWSWGNKKLMIGRNGKRNRMVLRFWNDVSYSFMLYNIVVDYWWVYMQYYSWIHICSAYKRRRRVSTMDYLLATGSISYKLAPLFYSTLCFFFLYSTLLLFFFSSFMDAAGHRRRHRCYHQINLLFYLIPSYIYVCVFFFFQ